MIFFPYILFFIKLNSVPKTQFKFACFAFQVLVCSKACNIYKRNTAELHRVGSVLRTGHP